MKGLANFYRDDQRELMHKIINNEKNPAIAAEAIRGLSKYSDEKSQQIITAKLKDNTFGNDLTNSAISTLKLQNNPANAPLLRKAILERKQDLSDRSFAQLLEAYATLASKNEKKDDARKLIASQLNDVRSRVKTAAVRSLGILGDLKATAVLQSVITGDKKNKLSEEANKAIQKLSEQKPFAPKEIVELRKELNDLKKQNERLEKIFSELKKKVESKK